MLAGDSKTEYDALFHGEIFEFFRLLKIFEKNQLARIKEMNKRTKK